MGWLSDCATLFLCGDLMLGQGIDKVLSRPGDPRLYEPYVRSALGYVALAERTNGAIRRLVDLHLSRGRRAPLVES